MGVTRAAQKLSLIVREWPNVISAPLRQGITGYSLNGTTFGNVSDGRVVNVRLNGAYRALLIATQRAQPHILGPSADWVSLQIRESRDLQFALILLRRAFEIACLDIGLTIHQRSLAGGMSPAIVKHDNYPVAANEGRGSMSRSWEHFASTGEEDRNTTKSRDKTAIRRVAKQVGVTAGAGPLDGQPWRSTMDENRRRTTGLHSRLRRDYFGLWIAIALIISTLGLTRYAVEVDETIPTLGEGPGHGNYCRIPERGVYFYGRDFDETVDTYTRFAEWCRQNDGILGWAE